MSDAPKFQPGDLVMVQRRTYTNSLLKGNLCRILKCTIIDTGPHYGVFNIDTGRELGMSTTAGYLEDRFQLVQRGTA